MNTNDVGSVRIVDLECWHANEIIYQATGRTDDDRCVFIRYRRPYFSVGIGVDENHAAGSDLFVTNAHPDHDPRTINLATLKAWTSEEGPRIVWPDRIHNYANETTLPDDPG